MGCQKLDFPEKVERIKGRHRGEGGKKGPSIKK